jgi:hypothetical protein
MKWIHHIYVNNKNQLLFDAFIVILASAGRIFYDPNPQIVQRKGSNSVTYKQNIIVRYLQPPPIPNAGPLVIKEVNSKKSLSLSINLLSFFILRSVLNHNLHYHHL